MKILPRSLVFLSLISGCVPVAPRPGRMPVFVPMHPLLRTPIQSAVERIYEATGIRTNELNNFYYMVPVILLNQCNDKTIAETNHNDRWVNIVVYYCKDFTPDFLSSVLIHEMMHVYRGPDVPIHLPGDHLMIGETFDINEWVLFDERSLEFLCERVKCSWQYPEKAEGR